MDTTLLKPSTSHFCPHNVMLAPLRILAPFIPLLLVALGAWFLLPEHQQAIRGENCFFFSGTSHCPGLLNAFCFQHR